MKTLSILLLLGASLLAQAPKIVPPPGGAPGNMMRYQPTYDDVKTVLGLTDDQLAKLKQLQTDKMAATQAFYTKMADKQKELNGLLETGTTDAAHLGQVMLDLQTLRKQPPPGGTDTHDRALAILTDEQKQKLARLEEASKMRSAVDQATQLALLAPVAPMQSPGGPQMKK